MASRIKAFGAFLYDFIIGDDWLVAALVVVGLLSTYEITHHGKVDAWWLIPLVLIAVLPLTLWRAVRKHSRRLQEAASHRDPIG